MLFRSRRIVHRHSSIYPSVPTATLFSGPAKTLPSPLQGMKIMSVEKGMAWIRWQGSAWAVREGDSLGNITITRIDPSSRAVITSAGTLR